MLELGLLKIWTNRYLPDLHQCIDSPKSSRKAKDDRNNNRSKVSLSNVMGAFVVLLVGYIASFFVFIGEKIIFSHNKTK